MKVRASCSVSPCSAETSTTRSCSIPLMTFCCAIAPAREWPPRPRAPEQRPPPRCLFLHDRPGESTTRAPRPAAPSAAAGRTGSSRRSSRRPAPSTLHCPIAPLRESPHSPTAPSRRTIY
jgi:hypothetical protein